MTTDNPLAVKWANTHAELVDLITEACGDEYVERMMAGYEDVDIVWDICQRCGAMVGNHELHRDWHRYLTLGIRNNGLHVLLTALRDDEADEADEVST